MKEIVVLSGKGGTGKSSLTASLGTLLGNQYSLVLADADVDAPNLHLLLDTEELELQEIRASDKAFIDSDLCSRCGACVDSCRFSSIISSEEPVIIPYSCEGCGACTLVCPTGAIRIQTVVNGHMHVFKTEAGVAVAGELDIGESSSGKLVDVVKKRARTEAETEGADFLLTDGPPGIGCPVIASVKGADYVLLVTEPTPSGLHDLNRVIEAIAFFKIPCGVVLNRADMTGGIREEVLHFLDRNKLPLLAEIPYDVHVPHALARGKSVVTDAPEAPASKALMKLSRAAIQNLFSIQPESSW